MSLKQLPAGPNPPEVVNAVIEIPQGSNIKYEVDEDSGVIFVDRILHTPMFYPANYGFVPSTAAQDGDPLDILVVTSQPLQPGTAILAQPIGLLVMEDEEGLDNKVVAVPPAKVDPLYAGVESVAQLPEIINQRINHFFERYKDLEKGKWVKVKQWQERAAALQEVEAAVSAFK